MPGAGGPSEGQYYSYDVGAAHVVVYSTEFYYFVSYGWEQIERQYQWLRRDLEEANRPENRAQHPWIIGTRVITFANTAHNPKVYLPLLYVVVAYVVATQQQYSTVDTTSLPITVCLTANDWIRDVKDAIVAACESTNH